MRTLLNLFFTTFVLRARAHRLSRFAICGCMALLLSAAIGARSQDTSLLKPPPGARLAIVEFDDLQCPACAAANPLLEQAAAKYRIPWVRHDFLIPYHNWSQTAAVNARWFDTRNKALGDAYRNEVFANQSSIETPVQLLQFTQKFAQSHGVAMPFAVDPQGKLLAEINADIALGNRIGIRLTPSIFIVREGPRGPSSLQVKDPEHDLFSTIDQAIAATHR